MTDTAIDHSTTRFRGQLIPLSGSNAPKNQGGSGQLAVGGSSAMMRCSRRRAIVATS